MLALRFPLAPSPLRWPVVLASASPRRRELLARLVADFTVEIADLDEDALTVADPVVTAEALARAKAQLVAGRRPEALVIGGDTVVALGERQFGKPRTAAEAANMLLSLSGVQHAVISAVAVAWPGGSRVVSDVARVTFRDLSREEVQAYVATGEPMDKAGAYAIQGGAGRFVAALDGAIETVIGLPVHKLAAMLDELGNGGSPALN
ncbi:MAG: Maf family protein [Fimbriimonadaceae bacterium]